jgi:RNA polymerase sigma-70 factor, ECF subfamily
MSTISDHALLQLVQMGDQQALVALYNRYSSLVYSIAFRVLRSPTAAEDVTQELFMRLWGDSEQIQITGETLHGWMTTASRNRAIDIVRRKKPEPIGNLILISPSDQGKSSEHRLTCEAALTLLEGDQRTLLEMAFLEEMTHAEIASATGWPLGTIKSRIRRALVILRITLAHPPFPAKGGAPLASD